MLNIFVLMGCLSGAKEDSGLDTASEELPGDSASTNEELSGDTGSTNEAEPVVSSGLRFNEIVAKSSTTADWIELYNTADESIDISGWGLVDDIDEDEPWIFPAGSNIEPDGYLLVWADDGEAGEGFHATFKLSSDGETVYLLDSLQNVVDEVSFPPLEEDQSYALLTDGAWVITDQPTPEEANE